MPTEAQNRVARLRAELRDAEQEVIGERELTRAATPVRYQYVIESVEDPAENRHHKMYDYACGLYKLTRKVANAQEAREAQHAEHELTEGSMYYVFNTATYRIVCAVGGGTSYIGPDYWSQGEPDGADDRAFEKISKYLISHPSGGDITRIVNQYLKERNGTH